MSRPSVIDTCYGNRALVLDGRRYTLKQENKNGTSRWQCANFRVCSSTVTTAGGRLVKVGSVAHACGPPDPAMVEKETFLYKCRKRAKEERTPILQIVREESAGLASPVDYSSIKSSLYRHRHKYQSEYKRIHKQEIKEENCTKVPQVSQPQQPPPQQQQQQQQPQQQVTSPGPAQLAPKKVSIPPPPVQSAPPEVCLRWNSYHSNMQATFPSLLNNEQFVDVTLACEGRSIKCHKVMLSACSSYFEELLSQNPCQHPIIFMRDLKFWEVQALVEFMYTGEVNVAQDKLPSLLTAAEALQIKGLTNPASSGGSGSYNSSHEEDSNTAPEMDDISSPLYPQPQKRVRKRKSTNPTSYQQKTQAVFSPVSQGSPIRQGSPMQQQGPPPGLTPMRLTPQHPLALQIAQSSRTALGSHRIKKEMDSSPPHLTAPHTTYAIKSEPDDSCDTLLDLSETDPSRKEPLALSNHEPLPLKAGMSSNGTSMPGKDNGLSEDEQTGSDCSEQQSMHIDPGESGDL